MRTIAPSPLTGAVLTGLLDTCIADFDAITSLCRRYESEADVFVWQRAAQGLLAAACEVARIVVDGVAALAALGRISVAHACCAAARSCQPTGLASAPLGGLAQTIERLFADTDALHESVRRMEVKLCDPTVSERASAGVRHFRILAASLRLHADRFIAAWPQESVELDLDILATSAAHVDGTFAATRTALAYSAPEEDGLVSMLDSLDDTLCRLAAFSGRLKLSPPRAQPGCMDAFPSIDGAPLRAAQATTVSDIDHTGGKQ